MLILKTPVLYRYKVIHFKSASLSAGTRGGKFMGRLQKSLWWKFSSEGRSPPDSCLNFMLRYQTLVKIKVTQTNVTGVKRQLVSLYYHGVNQRDENHYGKFSSGISTLGFALMTDDTPEEKWKNLRLLSVWWFGDKELCFQVFRFDW